MLLHRETSRPRTDRAASAAALTLFALGFSMLWPFLRRSFFGVTFSEFPDPQACYIVFIVCAGCVALGAFFARKNMTRTINDHPAIPFAVCIAATACMLASTLPAGIVPIEVRGFIVAAIMGTSFTLLVIMWGASSLAFASKQRIPALCAMVIAFILGFALTTVMVPLEGNASYLLMCFPALSGICWRASFRRQQPPGCKLAKAKQLPLARIVVLGAFLLLISLLRGPFYTGSIEYIPGWDVIPPNLLSVFMAVLTLVFLRLNRNATMAFRNAVVVSALVLLAGLLLAIYGDVASASLHLIIVGKSCFELFLWLLLADSGRSERISAVTLFVPLFLGFELAASLISYIVVPSLAALLNATFSSAIPMLALATAMVFVAGCFIYLGFESGTHASAGQSHAARATEDEDATAAIDAKLMTLGGYDELTPREREIATLLAQGNSYKRIAELLFVSPSTVQTHAKSLYRKLAIHSKQELVDQIQRESDTVA